VKARRRGNFRKVFFEARMVYFSAEWGKQHSRKADTASHNKRGKEDISPAVDML
jgi:hypothetical protein